MSEYVPWTKPAVDVSEVVGFRVPSLWAEIKTALMQEFPSAQEGSEYQDDCLRIEASEETCEVAVKVCRVLARLGVSFDSELIDGTPPEGEVRIGEQSWGEVWVQMNGAKP